MREEPCNPAIATSAYNIVFEQMELEAGAVQAQGLADLEPSVLEEIRAVLEASEQISSPHPPCFTIT